MVWTAQKIKNLRNQLSWGPTEFARRLGCKSEYISMLEAGSVVPDLEVINQLEHLNFLVRESMNTLSNEPLAESIMTENGLEQITQKQVHEVSQD